MPTGRGTFSRPCVGRDPPVRAREKSRGPSNRPLNWASYRGRFAKKVPNRAPTYTVSQGGLIAIYSTSGTPV
eukprot:5834616-Prymnesium_polylepis.1